MRTFYIGSQNRIKFNALNRALAEVFPTSEYSIIQRGVESEVPEQPLAEETFNGATNRCVGCIFGCKYTQDNEIYCIGVENGLFMHLREEAKRINVDGMIEQDNVEIKYMDKAVIVVRKLLEGKYEETIWESASVPVDASYVPDNREEMTWGDKMVIIEKELANEFYTPRHTPGKLTVDAKDPHYSVCGVSREDILYDVFKLFVKTLK